MGWPVRALSDRIDGVAAITIPECETAAYRNSCVTNSKSSVGRCKGSRKRNTKAYGEGVSVMRTREKKSRRSLIMTVQLQLVDFDGISK